MHSHTIHTPHADIRALLNRDHARLDDLFIALGEAFKANAREDAARLWTELDAGLEAHFRLEETQILPHLAQVDPAEAEALAREHGEIRAKLAELGPAVDLHLLRDVIVDELISKLRIHARREDGLMYRWSETHLSEHARSSIAARLGDPSPRTPK
mgnify:CR=1 FL=1